MSAFASTRASKAMNRPSGDQAGEPIFRWPNAVKASGFEPSLSQTQTSCAPERSELNAIRFPSGEICITPSQAVEVNSGEDREDFPSETGGGTGAVRVGSTTRS